MRCAGIYLGGPPPHRGLVQLSLGLLSKSKSSKCAPGTFRRRPDSVQRLKRGRVPVAVNQAEEIPVGEAHLTHSAAEGESRAAVVQTVIAVSPLGAFPSGRPR